MCCCSAGPAASANLRSESAPLPSNWVWLADALAAASAAAVTGFLSLRARLLAQTAAETAGAVGVQGAEHLRGLLRFGQQPGQPEELGGCHPCLRSRCRTCAACPDLGAPLRSQCFPSTSRSYVCWSRSGTPAKEWQALLIELKKVTMIAMYVAMYV